MNADDVRAKFPTLVDFIDSIKAEFGQDVRVKWLRDDVTGFELGRPSNPTDEFHAVRRNDRSTHEPR